MQSLDGRSIGLIEDDTLMGESLSESLELRGAQVRWWQSGREALDDLCNGFGPDALVCDMRLPDISGEQVMEGLRKHGNNVPILFMTAFGNIDQAVRLIRGGAGDYVTKPFDMPLFLDRLTSLLTPQTRSEDAVLGISQAMRDAEKYIARIAPLPGTVLITGETGVGKEVTARYLHSLACPAAPFVAVNCAAIPPDLLESELFGHERGAFTGANSRHLGYAERAGNGVLFLDEVGEMPLVLQVKLLRLIEERSFHRVGGEVLIPFSARIVAATNKDPEQAIADGTFREDLFYRLDTFPLELAPLRDRPEDIGWLLDRFVAAGRQSAGGSSLPKGASALAHDAALAHEWPGNVRELRNRVERAMALATGEWLQPADLFPNRRGAARSAGQGALSSIRDAAEKRAIVSALKDSGGRAPEAARLLGVSRTTLWEKMRRLQVGEGNP
ncbi:sigma-54-dependent transcriptional regulator [Devosia naphthalenivorans]|uniref:sigma-54-dependent transcriptional regulator n=1 Tax=Devosia naphthalenivorans TaxID=2082392 RepID=UPI000D375780|nr:sigma-54 dependent transcriptional regulator [Devosia naphthalenivorans]